MEDRTFDRENVNAVLSLLQCNDMTALEDLWHDLGTTEEGRQAAAVALVHVWEGFIRVAGRPSAVATLAAFITEDETLAVRAMTNTHQLGSRRERRAAMRATRAAVRG